MGNAQTAGKKAEGIGKEKTALFRQQHSEILETVGKITPLLVSAARVSAAASDIRKHLMRLGGQLSVHLSMEDKGLYPKLKGEASPEIAELTARYEAEMGGLKDAFAGYSEQWLKGNAISDRPQEFITQTQGLVTALGKRIEREDNELYPLVDKLS